MSMRPEESVPVTACVVEVLAKESAQRPPGTAGHKGFRHERERRTSIAKRQVEDDVLTVVQPFRVAPDLLPQVAEEGHGPTRRKEILRIDLREARGNDDTDRAL